MSGIERIAAERQRQIDAEGWSPGHDDGHARGELALAAACYALTGEARRYKAIPSGAGTVSGRAATVPFCWPWEFRDWRPTDRVRELEKAGALIAAEIDRLERAALAAQDEGGGE